MERCEADQQQLVQALNEDQRRRWQTAWPLRVEEYLAALPWLPAGVDWVRELAMGEFEARRITGTPQAASEISSRFPHLSSTLNPDTPPRGAVWSTNASQAAMSVPETEVVEQQDLLASFLDGKSTSVGLHGRYRLIRVLGEGSFGRVYLGFDEQLKRQVAIKVPSDERFRRGRDAGQYLSEAQTVATLEHPHIVSVYDVGRTEDGTIYVVSRYIDGGTLKDRMRQAPWAVSEVAELLIPVARALHFAHQRRLIHRDIKPENILLDGRSGQPFIADFGLAIREEDYLGDSRIAGTPSYMSPEQVRGEGHRLDGRSDVFSLGALLYELLTGVRPFTGSNSREITEAVMNLEPVALRDLRPDLPAELERICLKSLAKRCSDRYQSAAELADDLCEWLKPVTENRLPEEDQRIVPRGLRSFGAEDASYFLDLLPGPRNRYGLPESVAFWKSRLEQRDADQTFAVGLIYGPSGCGKSSLVKAGLLPSLSADIISVYIEATPDETEIRIRRALRKRIPELKDRQDLVEILAELRRTSRAKIVVIIDQFEQWLHAHRNEKDAELTRALLQCDGARVQAVLMIRDDFAMAASRLMRALDTRILEGHNFATVDLFDEEHARKILIKFGQAFGRLPFPADRLSRDEQQFVQSVASGLARDGRVVPVRLALFAEMVKRKPWEPATLQTVGGTQGIGVNFLEETFHGRETNPDFVVHAKATRAVLKSLLPEVDSDIKGCMRSHGDLLEVSGYRHRPEDFSLLIRILDSDLRLITPTVPEETLVEAHESPVGRYYQLTHDYLVPSLRDWLSRKQKETRRGRAELKLADRSALWKSRPENRNLPSVSEWLEIRLLVNSSQWSSTERQMMRRADYLHKRRVLAFLGVILAAFTAVLVFVNNAATKVRAARLAEAKQLQIALRSESEARRQQGIAEDQRKLADDSREEAIRQKLEAENAYRKASRTAYDAQLSRAEREIADGLNGRGIAILEGTDWELRGWEYGRLKALAEGTALVLSGHTGAVQAVAFNSDGTLAATASMDGTARIWNTSSGLELARLKGHGKNAQVVCWHPDGRSLASGANDQTARIWNLDGSEACPPLQHGADVHALAWHPAGTVLVSGGLDGVIKMWDQQGQAAGQSFRAHDERILSVAWSPDGSRLATAGGDGMVKFWGYPKAEMLSEINAHDSWVNGVAFSPDGQWLLTSGKEGNARVWRVSDGMLQSNWSARSGADPEVYHVAWSPDGLSVVFGVSDGSACIWDPFAGVEKRYLAGHGGRVFGVSWSTDGTRILTGSQDSKCRLWDLTRDESRPVVLSGHVAGVSSAAWSPDGKTVLTGSWDLTVRTWDAETGVLKGTTRAHDGVLWSARWSPDGRHIVTASADNTASLLDAATMQKIPLAARHSMPVLAAAADSSGRLLATSSDDKTVRIWGITENREIRMLEGHTAPVWSVCFSQDGRRILSASEDATARVWQTDTGKLQAIYSGHSGLIRSAVWSPDERLIATGSDDGTARIFDAATGKVLHVLLGHGGQVHCVAWSPDGSRIVTGSQDGTARIWNAETGIELMSIETGTSEVWPVAFSPDGTRVLVGSKDGTARIYRSQFKNTVLQKSLETADAKVRFSDDSRHVIVDINSETMKLDLPKSIFSNRNTSAPVVGNPRISPDGKFELQIRGDELVINARSLLTSDSDPWLEHSSLLPLGAWDLHVRMRGIAEAAGSVFAEGFHRTRIQQLDAQHPEIRRVREQDLNSVRTQVLLAEQTVDEKPDDHEGLQKLIDVRQRLADTLNSQGQFSEAITLYQQNLQQLEKLVGEAPDYATRLVIADAGRKLGLVLLQINQQDEAVPYLLGFIETARTLAQADEIPLISEGTWEETHRQVLTVYQTSGKVSEEEQFCLACLAFAEKLAAARPSQLFSQLHLCHSRLWLGELRNRQLHRSEAATLFEEAARSAEQSLKSYPDSAALLSALTAAKMKEGRLLFEQHDYGKVVEIFQAIPDRLSRYGSAARTKAMIEQAAEIERITQEANYRLQLIVGSNVAASVNRNVLVRNSYFRVKILLEFAGRPDSEIPEFVKLKFPGSQLLPVLVGEAVACTDSLSRLQDPTAIELYDVACCYGLCLATAASRGTEMKTLHDELQQKSLRMLKAAISEGFNRGRFMQEDPDLAPLRELPEFQELLKLSTNEGSDAQ